MRRVFWTFSAVVFAAGLMSTSAEALSLGLGTGKGGIINTGGGNGGLININTGGGSSQGGASGTGTVGGILNGGPTTNDVAGMQVGTDGPSPSGTSVSITGGNGLLNSLFGGVTGGLSGGGGVPGNPTPLPIGGGGVVLASYGEGNGDTSGLSCFMPNARQMATLFGRHDYAGNWTQGVSSIKVVKVPMCPAALAKVAAAAASNPNVLHLQDTLGTSSWATSQLARMGYTGSAVVAADRNGGTMTLYVI